MAGAARLSLSDCAGSFIPGGGGRIAIQYVERSNWSGNVEAAGGSCVSDGQPLLAAADGTVYWRTTLVNRGDIDNNLIIDLRDAIIVMQLCAGVMPQPVFYYKESDVNGDGFIGIAELVFILQKISGLR